MFTDQNVASEMAKRGIVVTKGYYDYGFLVRGVAKRAIHVKTSFTVKMYGEPVLFSILLAACEVAKQRNWKKVWVNGALYTEEKTPAPILYVFNESQAGLCFYNDDSKEAIAFCLGSFPLL